MGSDLGSPWNRAYEWLRRRVNARLVSFLNRFFSCDGPVLEAGSGTAYAASLMARRADHRLSVCMDRDIEALVVATRRDASLRAVVGDLNQMPFADESFAMVFNSSTVEHLDEPSVAVAEMQRICANEGTVFVGVPYAWGPLWFQPLVGSTRVGVWLGRVFSRSGLDAMLTRCGLTPVSHTRYFWNFFIGAAARKPTSAGTR
jgi:SAM-dependent methyltransferase